MSGYKTTYSTDEKQLYISDVNSYYHSKLDFSLLNKVKTVNYGKVL